MKSQVTRTKAEEERKGSERITKQLLKSNKMVIRTYISITMSNINGLNASTKRQTIAEWIKRQTCIYIYMLPTKDSLQIRHTQK